MKLTYLLIPTLLLILSACEAGSPIRQTLQHADMIMESHPDSALEIIEAIDTQSLSRDDLPYYALLLTQAQVKCHIPVPSDSLITIAANYYRRHGNDNLKMRAAFYLAYVAFDHGDYGRSINNALRAYEIANDNDDYYWIAKSAEKMGDIFDATYNYPNAKKYTAEAAEYYLKAGKILNHRFALCDLAITYARDDKPDISYALLDSISNANNADLNPNPILQKYIFQALVPILLDNKEYDRLNNIFENVDTSRFTIKLCYAKMKSQQGDYHTASKIYEELSSSIDDNDQKLLITYDKFLHLTRMGEYKLATLMVDSIVSLQTNVAYNILSKSVMSGQSDHYSHKAAKEKRNSMFYKRILIIILVSGILIISLGVMAYRMRMRAKKAEIESKLTSILYMKEQYERINKENKSLGITVNQQSSHLNRLQSELNDTQTLQVRQTEIIESLYRSQWDTVNMLCNEYFERGESEQSRSTILDKIEKELNKLISPKNIETIEQKVNLYLGNIVDILRKECTFLKEDDITFLTLIYAGFSPRAVCLFTNIKYKNFYLKKSRIIKRIAESDAPHRDLLLKKLSL